MRRTDVSRRRRSERTEAKVVLGTTPTAARHACYQYDSTIRPSLSNQRIETRRRHLAVDAAAAAAAAAANRLRSGFIAPVN